MSNKKWSNNTLLKSLKNPSNKSYEIKIKSPEITFLGVKNQPDFAKLFVIFYPNEKIMHILKILLHQPTHYQLSHEKLFFSSFS